MAVRVGYGGVAKLGAWAPVQVDVANEGPDLAGRVEVTFENTGQPAVFSPTPTIYSVPATFPQHSHKQLTVDVPVPAALHTNRVQVRLISGDQPVLQQAQEFDPVSDGTLLCGALDQTLGAYDFLSTFDLPGRQQRAKVADLSLSDLPTQGAALAGLDCLVIGDINLSAMTPPQKQALTTWVGHGGLLVAVGGANWQQSLPALPEQILPVRVTGLGALSSIAALDSFAHVPPSGPGPWAVAKGTLNGGVTVAGDNQTPLLAARRFGAGNAFFYALDPTQEPARSWAGNHFIWQYVLGYVSTPLAVNSYQQGTVSWGSIPFTALTALPSLNPPTPIWLILVLTGYAVLLGPLAYLLLRRIDRREWMLGILPAAAAVGTALTIHLALGRQGSDVAITEVTLLRAEAGAPVALTHTYVGLFAPRQQSIDFQAPGGSLVSPGRGAVGQFGIGQPRPGVHVSEGMDVFVPALRLGPAGLSVFTVDSQATLGAGIAGTLNIDGQFIRGQLQNKTGQRISDAAVVVGASVYAIGALGPNETRSISMPIPAGGPSAGIGQSNPVASQLYPTVRSRSPASDDPRRDILDRVLSSGAYANGQNVGGALFVGWLDQSPMHVEVRRARAAVRQLTLLEAGVPLNLDANVQGAIPSAVLEVRPLVNLGVTESQPGRYSIATGGSLGLQFDLPAALAPVQALHLLVAGSYSGGADLADGADLGTISLFDWTAGDWRSLPLAAGDNVLAPTASLVSPTGEVRLRYSFKPAAGLTASGVDFNRFSLVATTGGS